MTHRCVLALLLCIAGCKLKPGHNMEEQPGSHGPYKASGVFADGTSARSVPPGAVPRSLPVTSDAAWSDVVAEKIQVSDAGAAESAVIPFAITRDVLLRGQERFNIYCSVCHGRLGDGNGMIVQRGLTPPPSFHIDRLRAVSDGHLYNVITNGYGQMFSYNDRVSPTDRWMIVAYVRALQAASANAAANLTAEDRRQLQGSRP